MPTKLFDGSAPLPNVSRAMATPGRPATPRPPPPPPRLRLLLPDAESRANVMPSPDRCWDYFPRRAVSRETHRVDEGRTLIARWLEDIPSAKAPADQWRIVARRVATELKA